MKIKLAFFLVFGLTCSSCAKRGCGDFQEIVEQPGGAERVMKWADTMSMNAGVRWKRVGNGRVDMPGDYAVPFDLDSKSLGFDRHAEARVILDSRGKPVGVFIGEKNMQGIVVRFKGEALAMIPEKSLRPVNSRVFVMCIKGDGW